MQRKQLATHLTRLQKKHRSILLNTMNILWEDLEEERWLISMFDIIILSACILSTRENTEDIILSKQLEVLINLSLLMLKKSIKSSILIVLKRKLNIMESTKDIKSNQRLQSNQTFLFKLLLSRSKQRIKRSTKIGDQIR